MIRIKGCPGVAAWIVHSQKQIDAFPFAGFSRSGGKANRPLALKCSATDLSIALGNLLYRGGVVSSSPFITDAIINVPQ
jgi:hypothetical protein